MAVIFQVVLAKTLKRWVKLLALVSCVLLLPNLAPAQTVVVKMATLAPKGSSWHLILQQMAEKWKTISGGRVTVTLYPGGVAGDDEDVVRKMQLGTLNAALLTSFGLGDIDRNVLALQIPMLYDSYQELDFVREKMSPEFEKIYEQKGFVVLNWTDAGWVNLFARKPVRTPDDLRALKLFTGAGDVQTIELWKSAGFEPVPLPATEISTALQTGLITALPSPPQAAVILQWYNEAKYMTDLNWAVLIGATVISKKAWDKIPAELHAPLLEAAREAGKQLRDEIRQRGPTDVEAMQKRGLTVVHLDAAAVQLWKQVAENAYPKMRDKYVPAQTFDEAKRLRDEFRKQSAPVK